ncbi:MAG TPA: serine/threonine-protein kinase [Pirellulales bacterium]|nr:serine/threonine-protein kinase [Pirellulales bacterium]
MSTPPAISAVEPAAETDLSGRQLDDFRLIRRLGRGAMAEVYLAEQVSLRRQVAIKVLKPTLAGDATYVERFHHEAQAAASMVHANIVQIYNVGCCDGLHYIAQEYVAGQNLRELLARRGALDTVTAVRILRDVALALSKAAERGIVHRDIKPDNIMLAHSGEVKVADFGLARLVDQRGTLQLTQVGMTMGTPLYMSPEQVEGRPLDSRSDLYSLGVTCFHMLAGQPPFRGETALSIAVQHLKSSPERLEQLRPDLPPALSRIVHRLLAKQPAERYGNPRELLADLRQLKVPGLESDAWPESTGVEGFDTPGSVRAHEQLSQVMRTSALATLDRRKGRRRWLIVCLVAAMLGGALAWTRRDRPLLVRPPEPDIPRYAGAREQFLVAEMQTSHQEEWLKSVEAYFPHDDYFVPRSQEELIRLYMQNNRPADALKLAEKLARQKEPSQAEFRAFGLAGMAVAYTMQGRGEDASKALAELAPLRQKLDPRIAPLVIYVLQQNRAAMDRKASHDWEEWLKTLPAEPLEAPQSQSRRVEPEHRLV